MRPHPNDTRHNLNVGGAFRRLVTDLVREGVAPDQVDQAVGYYVNEVARAAYDLGQQEIAPSQN